MRAAHAAFSQGIRRSLSTSNINDDDEEEEVDEGHSSTTESTTKPPLPPRRSSSASWLASKLRLPTKKTTRQQQQDHNDAMSIQNRELVLPPGSQISDKELNSRYKVIGEVEGGGKPSQFQLLRAVEETSGELCVLKMVPRANLKPHPHLLTTLRKEALLAGQFSLQPHPNVCLPIRVSETRTQIAVELDAVEGGDLLEFLTGYNKDQPAKMFKWVNETHPGKILVQVLRGIEFLHSNRIIHGDIKPENILMTRRGVYLPSTDMVSPLGCIFKICDFGSSQLVPLQAGNDMLSGVKVGTIGYMAPEVMNYDGSGGKIGFESDMWSLGILLYVLLSGELPFEPTDSQAQKEFYDDPKRSLKKRPRWKKFSRLSRRFILELVAKDPADRLTIAAALQNEFLPGRRSGGDE